MIQNGQANHLIINRQDRSFYYLSEVNGDEEVFLTRKINEPQDLYVGKKVKAFVYKDKLGQWMASLDMPVAFVDEYALMTVVGEQREGAFFDWGIDKDLHVPEREQRCPMYFGDDFIVRVCINPKTQQLYGTTMLAQYIEQSEFDIEVGDQVDLIPAIVEEIGYSSVINKKFIGMIYHNEIFEDITIGKKIKAYVKNIREDGLVDAAIQKKGIKNLLDAKNHILQVLKKQSGKINLHDKSKPEDIQKTFNMSKKTFKNATGMLFKEGKILIHRNEGIEIQDKRK